MLDNLARVNANVDDQFCYTRFGIDCVGMVGRLMGSEPRVACVLVILDLMQG